MPREMFGDVVAAPRSARSRKSTLVLLSAAAHAAVGLTLLVVSLVASDALPTPRQALTFVEPPRLVNVDVPLPPPPKRLEARPVTPAVQRSPTAAPLVPPSGIAPETGREGVVSPVPDRAALGLVEGGGGAVGAIDGVGLVEAPSAPPPVAPVRLHSGIQAPQKLAARPPVYPAAARLAHVEGVVILEAVIDASGRVESVRVLRSVGLLDQAAIEAVRDWHFTPARLNGTAIPVVMTVTVSFKLQP